MEGLDADPFQFVAKYRENHLCPLDGNKVRAGDGKGELAKVAKKCSFDFFFSDFFLINFDAGGLYHSVRSHIE
jgi:hypothetical protein